MGKINIIKKHKKYAEYLKTNNSWSYWIKEIPSNWTTTRIKNTVESINNGVWGSETKSDGNDIICIRVTNFHNFEIVRRSGNFTLRNINRNAIKKALLKKGDLLIEKSGGGATQPVGRVVMFNLNINAVYSNFIAKFELSNIENRFLLYYFDFLYNSGINKRSIKQTTGIQNLDIASYLKEIICLPKKKNQKLITNFLDEKTKKIDRIIELKKQLIKLLKEKKESIIHNAVTKGLNPNAKMVDSGVDWIGKIPKDWEVKRLKYVSKIIMGQSPDSNDINTDEIGIPFLQGNAEFGKYKPTNKYWTTKTTKISKVNDILLSIRAPVGEINSSDKTYCIGRGLCAIRIIENSKYFYQYFLEISKSIIINLSSGSTFDNINYNVLSSLIIINPPYDAQKETVKFISSNIMRIQKIIDTEKRSVLLMNEYKQSIIMHAVTGKIKIG